jgi:hypothetical protein
MSTLLILLSLGQGYHHPPGPGYHNPPPLEDRRPRRSTPIQEPTLLATSVCLVSSYTMSCDTMGPHAPYIRTPNPHTPVKPRGSALIPLVTPRPLPNRQYLLLLAL